MPRTLRRGRPHARGTRNTRTQLDARTQSTPIWLLTKMATRHDLHARPHLPTHQNPASFVTLTPLRSVPHKKAHKSRLAEVGDRVLLSRSQLALRSFGLRQAGRCRPSADVTLFVVLIASPHFAEKSRSASFLESARDWASAAFARLRASHRRSQARSWLLLHLPSHGSSWSTRSGATAQASVAVPTLEETPVTGQAQQEAQGVNGCARAIVAASPRRAALGPRIRVR